MKPLHIAIVGPLPPPSGGMANQTRQLAELLSADGANVSVVQVNAPYRPTWIEKLPFLRAFFRLIPYLFKLRHVAGQVQVFHVMANSGWAWHLFAAPAVWIARLYGKRVIVNYRGGGAEDFLKKSFFWVRPTLRATDLLVVPSGFLQEVFGKWGIKASVIPNIINLPRFSPSVGRDRDFVAPHLVITRNLEPIYDIATALRAFALLLPKFPNARLTVAGSGPELDNLKALANQLNIENGIKFTGRLNPDEIAALYRSADLAINPSRVDNMPNSILEALACGIPVISTNVGGVPYIVQDGKTALLVPPGDSGAMAKSIESLLRNDKLAEALIQNGLTLVQRYSWPNVRDEWLSAYQQLPADHQQRSVSVKG